MRYDAGERRSVEDGEIVNGVEVDMVSEIGMALGAAVRALFRPGLGRVLDLWRC